MEDRCPFALEKHLGSDQRVDLADHVVNSGERGGGIKVVVHRCFEIYDGLRNSMFDDGVQARVEFRFLYRLAKIPEAFDGRFRGLQALKREIQLLSSRYTQKQISDSERRI